MRASQDNYGFIVCRIRGLSSGIKLFRLLRHNAFVKRVSFVRSRTCQKRSRALSPSLLHQPGTKQCHISDRCPQNDGGEGGGGCGGLRGVGSGGARQTEREAAYPLILRQADVPSPCVAGC